MEASMTLYLHDRDRRQRGLGAQAVDALVGVFTEQGEATSQRLHIAQDALRSIRADEHWIECGCAQDDGVGPLMSPRLLPSGQITLVRHGRVLHAETCPFFRMREHPLGHEAAPAPERECVARLDRVLSLDAGDAITDHLVLAAAELVIACGYTRCASTEVSAHGVGRVDINAHYSQTDRVAHLEVQGMPLSDLWCNHLSSVHRMLPRWRAGGVPVGLFFGIVNSLEDGELVRTPRSGEPARWRPLRTTERSPGMPGPYWVLARIDVAGGTMTDAYVWPVISGAHLMPVESDAERSLGRVLLGQIGYWSGRGQHYTVSKLVRAADVADAPAFRLESADRVIDVHQVLFPGRYQSLMMAVEAMHRSAMHAPDDRALTQFLINDEAVDTWRPRLTGVALRAL